TFGNGGLVITDISGKGRDISASAVAIDSTGRIVVAGGSGNLPGPVAVRGPSLALVRYYPHGSPDSTFCVGGSLINDTGGRDYANGVAIDGVGRIVVVGSSNGAFTLARHNSDGSLDNTFGGNTGFVVIANIGGSGGYEGANTVAIDGIGRIVAGGY